MNAPQISETQKAILRTFERSGILTPDDCSTFMQCFTCTIEQEFIDLVEQGLLTLWDKQTEEEFESQPYMTTATGRASL